MDEEKEQSGSNSEDSPQVAAKPRSRFARWLSRWRETRRRKRHYAAQFATSEFVVRLWIVASIVMVLLLVAFPGRYIYRHLKAKHGVALAREFLAKGDYRSAWLCARQELLANSNNIEAYRVMIELDDAQHSPAALDWCQRLVKLSPAITNKLLLASTGLRYQSPPYPLASQVLGDLSASASNMPDFHIATAELDLSLHRMAEAETEFEAASRLEPTNRLFQLNLAVVRLASTNTAAAADARAKLEQFRTDTNLGAPALRSLIADRLMHNDANGTLNYSTQLLANAHATLNDRLQHLGILKRLRSPVLAAQLNALQAGRGDQRGHGGPNRLVDGGQRFPVRRPRLAEHPARQHSDPDAGAARLCGLLHQHHQLAGTAQVSRPTATGGKWISCGWRFCPTR